MSNTNYNEALAYVRHTRTGCYLDAGMQYSPYLSNQSVDMTWRWTTNEAGARAFLVSVAHQVAAVYIHLTGDANVTIVPVENGGAA